jgi:hypothetical protein
MKKTYVVLGCLKTKVFADHSQGSSGRGGENIALKKHRYPL